GCLAHHRRHRRRWVERRDLASQAVESQRCLALHAGAKRPRVARVHQPDDPPPVSFFVPASVGVPASGAGGFLSGDARAAQPEVPPISAPLTTSNLNSFLNSIETPFYEEPTSRGGRTNSGAENP